MDSLEQIKSYLVYILQKESSQTLLASFPSIRDFHAEIHKYQDVDSLVAKLTEIEDDLAKKRKMLGFKHEHVYSLVVHINRMAKNADYLINRLGIPLVDAANKFFGKGEHSTPRIFQNGIPPEIYNRIQNFSLVYLSGAPINPYGHALLLAQDHQERPVGYFHVISVYDRPVFLAPDDFQRYLHEYQQEVIDIQHIPNSYAPRANLVGAESVEVLLSKEKLDDLCRKPWAWGMLKHNCLSFAKAVLKAGNYSCAELGGKNQAKRALNGRGLEGGLPLPRLRVKNVSPKFLSHDNYQAHISGKTLEQAFIAKLKTERILEINVDTIEDEKTATLSSEHKKGAFLRYVMQNTLQVHQWQKQLRASNKEDAPGEKAAADILMLIKQMILQVDWKIKWGGELVGLHRIANTMKEILKVVDREGSYANESALERLKEVRTLVKSADAKKRFTRTEPITMFYRNVIRESDQLLDQEIQNQVQQLIPVN